MINEFITGNFIVEIQIVTYVNAIITPLIDKKTYYVKYF